MFKSYRQPKNDLRTKQEKEIIDYFLHNRLLLF